MLLAADTLLTGAELLRPGWIDIGGATIRAVGAGVPPGPVDHDLGAATVVPGFVDTHVHGGGGANFSAASAQETATAAALHR
ncbi:MAG: N-acetylglucosamine-6-phosphate deacetylase, partial [Mycobacterium sp.]